jgi:hypothetical protein
VHLTVSGDFNREWQARCNSLALEILDDRSGELSYRRTRLCSTGDPVVAEPFRIYAAFMRLVEEVSNLQSGHLSLETATTPLPPDTNASVAPHSRIIFWSHHLLSTAKRRSIQEWCTELQLWGISRPGYPGVIVIEGPFHEAAEFTRRIKALRWQALSVRYEETMELDEGSDLPNGLARVLKETRGLEKPSGVEVEEISQVHALMERARLGDIFLDAMKIRR